MATTEVESVLAGKSYKKIFFGDQNMTLKVLNNHKGLKVLDFEVGCQLVTFSQLKKS